MREWLQRLHESQVPVSTMTYETAIERAAMAADFVRHPYWPLVSRMLTGTIQVSTDELLASDEHKDSNRAAVAMCRKFLNMPFFDIEQGRLAQAEFDKAKLRAGRRFSQSGHAPHEVQ